MLSFLSDCEDLSCVPSLDKYSVGTNIAAGNQDFPDVSPSGLSDDKASHPPMLLIPLESQLFSSKSKAGALKGNGFSTVPKSTISSPAHSPRMTSNPAELDSDMENITSKVLISNNNIGAVIGKGGAVICSIRSSTAAKITISDCKRQGYSEDREVIITGKKINVVKAFGLILVNSSLHSLLPLSSKTSIGANEASNCLSYRLLIPNAKVGGLIGRGGAHIKQLRQRSGARIDISSCNDICDPVDDRVVTVSGDLNCCLAAYKMINSKLLEVEAQYSNAQRIGSPRNFFVSPSPSPRHSNEVNFFDEGFVQNVSGVIHYPKTMRTAIWSDEMANVSRQRSASSSEIDQNGRFHLRQALPSLRSLHPSSVPTPVQIPSPPKSPKASSASPLAPKVHTDLTREQLKYLSGKQANGIQEIKQVSGADINCSVEPGSDLIRLNITGTPEEMQLAQYLVRMKISKAQN